MNPVSLLPGPPPGWALAAQPASGQKPATPSSPEQADRAAQEFESLLLGTLLKALRKTIPASPDAGHMGEMYRELLDEQLAADLARKGGIGLAAAVRAYLGPAGPGRPPTF